jgi:hypothetical protein
LLLLLLLLLLLNVGHRDGSLRAVVGGLQNVHASVTGRNRRYFLSMDAECFCTSTGFFLGI